MSYSHLTKKEFKEGCYKLLFKVGPNHAFVSRKIVDCTTDNTHNNVYAVAYLNDNDLEEIYNSYTNSPMLKVYYEFIER